MNVTGVRPGEGFVATLSGAYRQAVQSGQPVVGSALVLRHGVRRVRELRKQFPPRWSPNWRPAPRIADGPPAAERSRLFPAFDEQVELFAEGALREAAHRAGRANIEFSPLVRHAVYEAVHEASRRDQVPAGVRHLVLAVLGEPGNGAAVLAGRMWVVGHSGGLGLDRQSPLYRAGGPPALRAADALRALRVLPSRAPLVVDLPWRAGAAAVVYWSWRRPYRLHGERYGHPIPGLIEHEAGTQAVRRGRDRVDALDVLLGILEFHEQLRAAEVQLPEPVARYNTAGDVLREHGITLLDATVAADRAPESPTRGGGPPVVPLYERLRMVSRAAWQAGDPFVGTSQLLAGLLRDRNGPVARLLRELGAEPDVIAAKVG